MKEAFLLLKNKVEKNDNLKYHSGYYIDIRKKQDISNRIREKKKVCKNCGKLICDNAEYCVDCYNLNRRVVERPSRDVLKYEIRNYPFIKLSEKYGVTDKTKQAKQTGGTPFNLKQTDSLGNELSPEQIEFFKDSKVTQGIR